jgi:hypothetical protein
MSNVMYPSSKPAQEVPKRHTLKVLYDMRFAPITFDFTTFLVVCDCIRQLDGYNILDFTFRADEFRQGSTKDFLVQPAEKLWRLKNVVLDTCDLLPTAKNTRIIRDISQAAGDSFHIPANYQDITNQTAKYAYSLKDLLPIYELGANPIVLTAPEHAKNLINSRLGRGYITLSLRTSNHIQKRNIALEQWYKFYCYLIDKGHEVVVVPDFEDLFAQRLCQEYDWDLFLPPAFDQRLRMALYEGALMNFSTGGGTAAMAIYSNAPYAIFDLINDGWTIKQVTEMHLGLSVGESCPWALDNQRYFWDRSTFEYLVSAYETFNL